MKIIKLPICFCMVAIVLLSSCKNTQIASTLNENVEKRKWKKELLANGIVGKEFKKNDTVSNWLKENSNNTYAMSDKITIFKSDFNANGEIDLLLTMNLAPSVGGNGERSTLLKLLYKNGEEILSNSVLTQKIEKMIRLEFQKSQGDNFSLEKSRVIFQISNFKKTINGNYEMWINNDAHCCPSYKGIFKYDLMKKEMTITN